MRIGEAARRLDIATHVLRHWDDLDVVRPRRTASGHREYTEEQVQRLRVVRACQGAGMPLSSIRTMLHEGGPERSQEIARQLDRVRAQRRELLATEEFLEHVVTCTHSVLTKCTDCSAYAGRERVGEFGR